MRDDPTIGAVRARAYTVPTDVAEADGTLSWDRTTVVAAHVEAGGETGLGYSYTDASVTGLIAETLAPRLEGLSALDVPRANAVLRGAVRNFGRSGLAANAVSALDAALWDLKARLLGLPLASLFIDADGTFTPKRAVAFAEAAQAFGVAWFHDHARIEGMLFDGAPVPRGGAIAPDLTRPGHGLTLKTQDADAYAR